MYSILSYIICELNHAAEGWVHPIFSVVQLHVSLVLAVEQETGGLMLWSIL
jgi:hypothetical protein